jgi:diacylglycerol kinase (ATP)
VRKLLVAGGDGSCHETLNGIMRARASGEATGDPPLLVPLPLGTGNDWARSLAFPADPAQLARLVAGNHDVAWHDAGCLTFPDAGDETRWFINVAGAGFDAHVIAQMAGSAPSRFAYLSRALRALPKYRSPEFRILADAQCVRSGRLLLAFVANGQYCGHRMHVAPGASTDDGLLDVVSIAQVGIVRALPKLLKLYRGTILGDPLVRHHKARSVCIEATPAAPVEADGQPVGATPVHVDIVPRAVRVLRPRPRR